MHKSFPFYNISHAVGKGGLNYGDDVWLVQYLLTEIANHPTGGGQSAPKQRLQLNGVYSPLMDDWILWFQRQLCEHGRNVRLDGRIDPLPSIGNQGFCRTNLQSSNWCITHLNSTFRKRYRSKHDRLEDQTELGGVCDRIRQDDYVT